MEKDSITVFGKKLKKLEFPPQHLDEYLEYLKTCEIPTPSLTLEDIVILLRMEQYYNDLMFEESIQILENKLKERKEEK